MARITIEVATIKATANRALSDPEVLVRQDRYMTPVRATAYREGVAAVLESVLMASGNYRGFRFADGEQGKRDETVRVYY